MKQIEVTILGQSYLLGCPEGGEALLHRAVARVDQEMSGIRDAGKVKARERMAVLAALNLAYQLADHEATLQAATAAANQQADGPKQRARDTRAADEPGDVDPASLAHLIQRIDTALGDDGHLL